MTADGFNGDPRVSANHTLLALELPVERLDYIHGNCGPRLD